MCNLMLTLNKRTSRTLLCWIVIVVVVVPLICHKHNNMMLEDDALYAVSLVMRGSTWHAIFSGIVHILRQYIEHWTGEKSSTVEQNKLKPENIHIEDRISSKWMKLEKNVNIRTLNLMSSISDKLVFIRFTVEVQWPYTSICKKK